jgi:hypothetical protein
MRRKYDTLTNVYVAFPYAYRLGSPYFIVILHNEITKKLIY